MTAQHPAVERELEDARQDARYPVVLQEIRSFTWATTSLNTDGYAELLAARVVAAIRRQDPARS